MRFKQGVVVSTKMNKTVKVVVERLKAHPKYKKRYKVSTKLYAHNENPDVKVGDKVMVVETRPISKLKRWRVVSEKEHDEMVKEHGTDTQAAKLVIKMKEYIIPYKARKKKVRKEEAPKAPEASAAPEAPKAETPAAVSPAPETPPNS